MKKFLSLVLALVMTMSLVTVSAGAKDFTDDSKITYEEAVDVMSAVGVIDGYEDGSFQPTTNLTRGAAAKIICNLILGPTTAAALGADTAPYSDVPTTNTFAGYIAYCQKEGIISGYADGTFRPSAPLTGYAFLKMLLGALGYDGVQEGYTGANWSINVAKQAIAIGLTKGNDEFVGQASVNREEAMLYAFNTMKATMVEYGDKTTVTVNGATIVTQGEAKEVKQTGYDDIFGGAKAETLQFCERYFPKLDRTRSNTDAFGRPAAEWKYGSEIIGTYADYTDLVETYTDGPSKGELYNVVGASTVKNLGTGKDDYSLTVWMDGEIIADGDDASAFFEKNASGGFELNDKDVGGKGSLVEVYVDDDNNVTIVIVNTYLVKATADYNEKKETLSIEAVEINEEDGVTPSFSTVISNDDVPVADFSEGDYILVTYSHDTDAIESAVKAEVLTGEVSEYTQGKNVIIDGTKYSYNYLVGSAADEKETEYTIGEDAKVVMDAYGYIIYVDEALSTSSYVFIEDIQGTTSLGRNFVAAAYFTDGSYKEINLKKIIDEAGDSHTTGLATDFDRQWYTFSVNSADQYTLTAVKNLTAADKDDYAGDDSDATVVMKNGVVSFLPEQAGVKANDSTIVVVMDADLDATAYTGVANVPDIKTGTGSDDTVAVYALKDDNGYAKYVFVDASNENASVDDAASVADYLFILKGTSKKTVSGENTYYQCEVILDGEETTKYIEESIFESQGELFYNVKENDKGYITAATEFPGSGKTAQNKIDLNEVGVITYSAGTMSISGDSDADLLVNSSSSINLVVGAGATELLKDPDADYETYLNISANALAGYVKNYTLDGTVYYETTKSDNQIVKAMYVYITDAVETDPQEPTTDLEKALNNAIAEVAAAEYTVNGDSDGVSAAEVRAKVAELAEAAITDEELTYTATARIAGGYTAPETNGSSEVDVEITVTVEDSEGEKTLSDSTTVTVVVDGKTA